MRYLNFLIFRRSNKLSKTNVDAVIEMNGLEMTIISLVIHSIL